MNNKSILIKQHDITDCGAACIASISGFYKLKLPIAQIRKEFWRGLATGVVTTLLFLLILTN